MAGHELRMVTNIRMREWGGRARMDCLEKEDRLNNLELEL